MANSRVHLRGQEHLPPFLKELADESYQYSAHKHTIESTEDGVLHTYSVILSQYPLKGQILDDELSELERSATEKTGATSESISGSEGKGTLVSQINSTTTSEKNVKKTPNPAKESVTSSASSAQRESQYMNLSSISDTCGISSEPAGQVLRAKVRPKDPKSSSSGSEYMYISSVDSTSMSKARVRPATDSSYSGSSFKSCTSSYDASLIQSALSSSSKTTSLPKFTYSSASVKSARSAKYVMMVHVKFLLLHRDVFRRRVQSMFTDEFPSDCSLEDVVYNFHQLCSRHFRLRDNDFNPRLSYCIGELCAANSKPVLVSDMHKTLAQLAHSNSIIQFSLIVDNIED